VFPAIFGHENQAKFSGTKIKRNPGLILGRIIRAIRSRAGACPCGALCAPVRAREPHTGRGSGTGAKRRAAGTLRILRLCAISVAEKKGPIRSRAGTLRLCAISVPEYRGARCRAGGEGVHLCEIRMRLNLNSHAHARASKPRAKRPPLYVRIPREIRL